jgi:hypothetical protein
MQLLSGTLSTLVVAGLAVAGLVRWLMRDRHYPGPQLVGTSPGIDRDALERAERELHMLEPAPDELLPRELRPGVPRPPERL